MRATKDGRKINRRGRRSANRDRGGEKEKAEGESRSREREREMEGLRNFISLSWFRRGGDFPFHGLAKAASETYYDNFYQFVYQTPLLVLGSSRVRTSSSDRKRQSKVAFQAKLFGRTS